MSRKYLNDRWCVRCGRNDPTPYLLKNMKLLESSGTVVDVGCGNGRNSKYLASRGFYTLPFDMAGDFGQKIVLGHDPLPLQDDIADIILANYVFMFLDKKERTCLLKEIKRIAKADCVFMVELYAAKDSHAVDAESVLKMQEELFNGLGKEWSKLRWSKERFIAKRV